MSPDQREDYWRRKMRATKSKLCGKEEVFLCDFIRNSHKRVLILTSLPKHAQGFVPPVIFEVVGSEVDGLLGESGCDMECGEIVAEQVVRECHRLVDSGAVEVDVFEKTGQDGSVNDGVSYKGGRDDCVEAVRKLRPTTGRLQSIMGKVCKDRYNVGGRYERIRAPHAFVVEFALERLLNDCADDSGSARGKLDAR